MLNNKLSKEQILDIQNARKSSNETLDFTTNPPTRGPVEPFNRNQISIIPKTDLSFLDTSIRVNPEKIISAMQLPAIVLNQGTIQGEASYKKIVSTEGACPACVVAGATFELSGGVSFPSGDGPVGGEQGFPLTAYSSCESLEAEIADLLELYAGTSIRPDYPILWSATYKDGTTISGSGCESVPAEFTNATAQNTGLSEEECSDLSELYPNVNISFNTFGATAIDATAIIPPGQIRCPGSYWIT